MPDASLEGSHAITGRAVGDAPVGVATWSGGVMSTVVAAGSDSALALPAASVATTV